MPNEVVVAAAAAVTTTWRHAHDDDMRHDTGPRVCVSCVVRVFWRLAAATRRMPNEPAPLDNGTTTAANDRTTSERAAQSSAVGEGQNTQRGQAAAQPRESKVTAAGRSSGWPESGGGGGRHIVQLNSHITSLFPRSTGHCADSVAWRGPPLTEQRTISRRAGDTRNHSSRFIRQQPERHSVECIPPSRPKTPNKTQPELWGVTQPQPNCNSPNVCV